MKMVFGRGHCFYSLGSVVLVYMECRSISCGVLVCDSLVVLYTNIYTYIYFVLPMYISKII